jgi:hypothetical protein
MPPSRREFDTHLDEGGFNDSQNQGCHFACRIGRRHCLCRTASGTQYGNADLKKMIHEAHTTQQYQALAAFFRSRQQAMEQQAKEEKAEWERRSQITTGIAQKYPRPVDSSRNRYEYFPYEAEQMSQQAAHYESLAASAPQ